MLNNPIVSVILPVYNAETYVSDTIQSILNQSFQNFELIIINDCSTDNSLSVIQKFQDPRIIIINNERNLKLIKTLNRGIQHAKGKYIARCDADDIFDKNRFEKQVHFLEKNPEIGVLGTDAWIIDQNNFILKTTYNFPSQPIELDIRLKNASPFFHPSVMFRKNLVNFTGPYSEDFLHVEDYALWLNLFSKTKLANLNDRLIYYRIHSSSISGQNSLEQLKNSERARLTYLSSTTNYEYLAEKWKNLKSHQIIFFTLKEKL